MTSDGIITTDWEQVQELACEIVNTSSTGNEQASLEATERLLLLLDTLQEKYGELPSILATKADYLDDTTERVCLLKRAYERAGVLLDNDNLLLICFSIAEIYIDELTDLENSQIWLQTLERNLADSLGDSEDLNNLKRKFEELKKKLSAE